MSIPKFAVGEDCIVHLHLLRTVRREQECLFVRYSDTSEEQTLECGSEDACDSIFKALARAVIQLEEGSNVAATLDRSAELDRRGL